MSNGNKYVDQFINSCPIVPLVTITLRGQISENVTFDIQFIENSFSIRHHIKTLDQETLYLCSTSHLLADGKDGVTTLIARTYSSHGPEWIRPLNLTDGILKVVVVLYASGLGSLPNVYNFCFSHLCTRISLSLCFRLLSIHIRFSRIVVVSSPSSVCWRSLLLSPNR